MSKNMGNSIKGFFIIIIFLTIENMEWGFHNLQTQDELSFSIMKNESGNFTTPFSGFREQRLKK